jgi:hypothetical protein
MFLFTSTERADTPVASPAQKPVTRAIESAAGESGVSFDYLLRTAKRESSLDPQARASTSSATGLFQFVEQTWLGLIKKDGARLGLPNAAAAIVEVSPGRYDVPDRAAKQFILDLRKDPEVASRVAGVFTNKNKAQLNRELGRAPSQGELYMAHFLGAGGASDFIRMASREPDAPAARYFPDAASANRSIFYDNAGGMRSLGDVYSRLASKHGSAGVAAEASLPVTAYSEEGPYVALDSKAVWSGFGGANGKNTGFGLFRDDAGPVSAAVKDAWGERAPRAADDGLALRSTLSEGSDSTASVEAPRKKRLSERPLPIDDTAPMAKTTSRASKEPLDLLQFMRLRG